MLLVCAGCAETFLVVAIVGDFVGCWRGVIGGAGAVL